MATPDLFDPSDDRTDDHTDNPPAPASPFDYSAVAEADREFVRGAAAEIRSRHERATADPVWRLPLWPAYADNLKSNIADMRNDGGPFAGAVVAALFLKRFVVAPEKWIHLDIYAWNPERRAGRPVGGEAMAMRAVYDMIRTRFAS